MPNETSSSALEKNFNVGRLVRIFLLHQRLCQGARMTAPALADETGVDERTSQRDIAALRDDLGAPVGYDASGKTHYYERTCEFLPFVKLTPSEAFAIAVAVHAFAAAEGASAELVTALEKLTPLIGGIVSFPLKELSAVVSAPATGGELRFSELLVHAAMHRRELKIKYLRLTPGAKPKEHLLDPLHLAPLDHQWTLIARVSGKKAIKHFVLTRMQEVAATGQTFERPADFDVKQHLAGSIGRFAGHREIEVRLAFAPKLAGYAKEEFRRNPSAKWAERPDGRSELTVHVNNYADIKNTVMRYGEYVEVLAPQNLREKVRDAHNAAGAQYA